MSSLHFLFAGLVTTGAGAAMLWIGMRSGLLKARVESRRCASCGHRIDGWHCPTCSRR